MHILFLNENPLPRPFTKGAIAGKELRLRAAITQVDQILALSPQGNTVVDARNIQQGLLEKKITILHFVKWPYYLTPIPLFFIGWYQIKRFRPNVIEAESPILSGVSAVLLGRIFRLPVIVEVRASYDALLQHRLSWIPLSLKKFCLVRVENFVFNQASAIIANSKHYKRKLAKRGFQSIVINPGIDKFQPIKRKPHSLFTIGYLGRLEVEKGCLLLLEALKLLNQNHSLDGKWQALIAGEGHLRSKLEVTIAKHNLTQVNLVGFQPRWHFLSKIDVLVNPNLVLHPLEMVNVEAASVGVPVICFGNKSIPETVVNKSTGLVLHQLSAQNVAQNLTNLIQKPNLLSKVVSEGPQFARQHYSFVQQQLRLFKVYKQLGLMSPKNKK